MKKQIFIFISLVCLTVFHVSKLHAHPPKDKGVILSITQKDEEKLMVSRLYEIHQMDKSNLSANERKMLRKEVKSIKSKMTEMKGGYIFLLALSLSSFYF